MKISVIIPTKNRHRLLVDLIYVLETQTVRPFELIIIDQSDAALNLESELQTKLNINYQHNQSITSLVEAKCEGIKIAKGDLIAFLDDDSKPDQEYFESFLNAFANSEAVGMCGFVSNYEFTSKLLEYLYKLFHHGFYKGCRIGIFGKDNNRSSGLIRTHQLTGGCSIWKREVFLTTKIDVDNKLHYFEDVDFSYRVNLKYDGRLYINTGSLIEDLYAKVGKRDCYRINSGRMVEAYVVYIKFKESKNIHFYQFALYSIGRFLDATFQSIKNMNLSPIFGFCNGLKVILIKRLHGDTLK